MLYPWQRDDWARIVADFERVPNAWLLTGAEGIGQPAFARHLAQALLCDAPGATGEGCGQCESCRWLAADTHPDFRLLTPDMGDDDKGARRLAQIKIDAVRELMDFAHLSAHRASVRDDARRVVLIEPAEALNPSAANALLKVLEEPPSGVVFILVAHAPQRLLPTIKSRCRAFTLARPGRDAALSWLQQQGVADAESELAYHGGVPLFEVSDEVRALRRRFVAVLAQPTLGDALAVAEQVDKARQPLALPLEWLAKWLLDLAGLRLAEHIRYHPDQEAALRALAGRADPLRLLACQERVQALTPYGQHTLNVRLQTEALLMDYLKVFAARGRSPRG